ncbi:MAG: DUF5818 domain-containing protein [Terriglobia bacterium]
MNIRAYLVVALLTCASTGFGAAKTSARRSFTGAISDSACGLHHMMAQASPQKCTLECVDMGAKFVLAVQPGQEVYALSDQNAARPYAGEKVKVTGTLKGRTIQVVSIQPATQSNKK